MAIMGRGKIVVVMRLLINLVTETVVFPLNYLFSILKNRRTISAMDASMGGY